MFNQPVNEDDFAQWLEFGKAIKTDNNILDLECSTELLQ